MPPPIILITNDDGFEAPGLAALTAALDDLGRVVVVAPDRERSGTAHALTLDRPLRVTQVESDRFRVDGTPTDCVHLGVFSLTPDARPAIVVAGINRGLNVGDDVTYSGTVAGALEGTLLHIPSVALSAERGPDGSPDYALAARCGWVVVSQVLERGLADGTFLNVNVPHGTPCGWRVTRQGTRSYRASVEERLDPSGRPYFWIAGADTTPGDEPDGDHRAIEEGWISISPLHANLTHEPSLAGLSGWQLDTPEPMS